MKKVGILVGRERRFLRPLLKTSITGSGEVTADYIKLGGIRHDARRAMTWLSIEYLMSSFYRATLKRMALEGTIIINNPFWWSADDKFFNYSLARNSVSLSQDGPVATEGLHVRHQRELA